MAVVLAAGARAPPKPVVFESAWAAWQLLHPGSHRSQLHPKMLQTVSAADVANCQCSSRAGGQVWCGVGRGGRGGDDE